MNAASNVAKPFTLVGIAVAVIAAGGVLGALTNSINGAVSPNYFRNILRWYHVENIWRAAVAQGIFEGLIYGAIFSIIFIVVVGISSKARASFSSVRKHLLCAGTIPLLMWCIGGAVAMGLATLSPDFYRSTFIGVPSDFPGMIRYAWVGGSIWGVMLGAVLTSIIVPVVFVMDWRRQNHQSL